ncbi:ABC transporter permease [Luedemannella flava]
MITPFLILVTFGVGVGAYVGRMDGVPYADYLVPGLLAAGAVQLGTWAGSYPVFSGLNWLKNFHLMFTAPLRVGDVLAGHALFAQVQIAISGAALLLVAAAFGTLHSWWALVALPVAGLVGLSVFLPMYALAASVRVEMYMNMTLQFVVLPLTLFAGVYFPVSDLPTVLRALAYASPLWHAADLCRAATLGRAPDWSASGHVVYLLCWVATGGWLAHRALRKRLYV